MMRVMTRPNNVIQPSMMRGGLSVSKITLTTLVLGAGAGGNFSR
jgi:hypothetical protein